jgi:ribosomal protein L11 methyltransferase
LPEGRASRGDRDPFDEGLSAVGTWIELAVEADNEAVEAVSEILARVAPGGIAIEPAFEPVREGLAARVDATRPAVVRAFLPGADASGARAAVERVRTELGHLQAFGLRPIGELRVGLVDDTDWGEAWKQHFPVLRVGRRLLVRPPWRRYRARDGEAVVVVDPGPAFGTGLHPTTRLCLEGLERWADAGRLESAYLLDLGSGSGILSVAAARLGARSVVALDTDPIAVEATERNAARNGLAHAVRAAHGSLSGGGYSALGGSGAARGARFDLVVANLVASVLVELAAPLYDALRPGAGTPRSGGALLCSGILEPREPEVRRAFAATGLRVSGRWADGEWVALEAERVD